MARAFMALKMIDRCAPASVIACCSSSPSSPGIATSSTAQPGTVRCAVFHAAAGVLQQSHLPLLGCQEVLLPRWQREDGDGTPVLIVRKRELSAMRVGDRRADGQPKAKPVCLRGVERFEQKSRV